MDAAEATLLASGEMMVATGGATAGAGGAGAGAAGNNNGTAHRDHRVGFGSKAWMDEYVAAKQRLHLRQALTRMKAEEEGGKGFTGGVEMYSTSRNELTGGCRGCIGTTDRLLLLLLLLLLQIDYCR
jgi:hypothetical protein